MSLSKLIFLGYVGMINVSAPNNPSKRERESLGADEG
jgi:hypothetical protein